MVRPVVLRTDMENSPNGGEIFLDNGQMFIRQDSMKSREKEKSREKTAIEMPNSNQ